MNIVQNARPWLLKKVNRVVADFFMPCRLGIYEEFLRQVIEAGYQVCPMHAFWELTDGGTRCPAGKYMLLRHDIDTDVATAKIMWSIEQALGIKSSYFFRLNTVDVAFMREIETCGSEASYHFEELATYAKRNHIKTPEQAMAALPAMRDLFRQNLSSLRKLTGLPMTVVAAHGDFVNRRLGITSCEVLASPQLRDETRVVLEVYDSELMQLVGKRYADAQYPSLWSPCEPKEALTADTSVIYVLVHPRQWKANWWANLVDNMGRLVEGIRYAW